MKGQVKNRQHFPSEMTWAELQDAANNMTEGEAFEALELEKNGRRRKSYMMRLYSRFSSQRSARERQAIEAWAVDTKHGDH